MSYDIPDSIRAIIRHDVEPYGKRHVLWNPDVCDCQLSFYHDYDEIAQKGEWTGVEVLPVYIPPSKKAYHTVCCAEHAEIGVCNRLHAVVWRECQVKEAIKAFAKLKASLMFFYLPGRIFVCGWKGVRLNEAQHRRIQEFADTLGRVVIVPDVKRPREALQKANVLLPEVLPRIRINRK